MKQIKLACMLGGVLAVQGALAQDLTDFSNKVDQVLEENAGRAQEAVEANKQMAINQAIGRELGRTVEDSRDPAAIRTAHQALVEAYIADIKRRIEAPDTAWPAGSSAKAWKEAAGSRLDQAAECYREAVAAGADVTSSLRIMAQVRAWTFGKKTLSPNEDWTATVESAAETMTTGKPISTEPGKTGSPGSAPAAGGASAGPTPPASASTPPSAGPTPPPSAGPTPPSTPVPAAPVQPPEQSPEPPARVPSALPASQSAPASPAPSSVSPPSSGGTTVPTPAAPAVTLTMVNSREKLGVRHNLTTDSKAAWIGFYRTESGNKNYMSYAFLNNLTGGLYDVPRPEEPGSYQFRIFADEGFKPAAVSTPIEIR